MLEPRVRLHGVMIHDPENYILNFPCLENLKVHAILFCVHIEGEGDSEPDDARPSSFRKAGSESSATDSKIIKVSPGIFIR